MVLQESDMFMDALTAASTKNKEPRKRKRRTSLTKDGPPEVKKSESSNSENNRDTSPPLTSPTTANAVTTSQKTDEKTLLKPTFKVLLNFFTLLGCLPHLETLELSGNFFIPVKTWI